MPTTTRVRDVMSTQVATLRADQPITDAADVLAERGYGAMPVVDEQGRLVGLLRDEDLIVSEARVHVPTVVSFLGAALTLPGDQRRFEEEIRKVAGATVGEVMDTDPVTIGADGTLEDLATLMHEHDVSHLPVVDDTGALVGIVARGDLVRFIARTT
jgi:CBS domain-containing protein